MTKQRRAFSPEFKRQAASLVLDQGDSHVEASRSVSVGETDCIAGCASSKWNARASRRRVRQSRRINSVFRNSRRVSNASSVRRPF